MQNREITQLIEEMPPLISLTNVSAVEPQTAKLSLNGRHSPLVQARQAELSLISEIFSNSVRDADSDRTPQLLPEPGTNSKSDPQSSSSVQSDDDYSLASSYDSEIAAHYQE